MLDALAENPLVRGIRQQLHWHANPAYRFAEVPALFRDEAWQRGLALVAARGWLFELQVFPDQLADAADLVEAFPHLTFVLVHAGMLEDRSSGGWATWRDGMRRIASLDNCLAKLSGLGTFERSCTPDLWHPVVHETIALFGPSRCLFGSNYPIEKLWTPYARIVEVIRSALHAYAPAERRAVLHDTAARVYAVSAGR